MSTNSGIIFNTPLVPKAHSLTVMESLPHINTALAGRALPSYPPLRLSQILKLIKNGTAQAVTVIEWLGVFGDRLEIDDAEACEEACILLWQAISEDERVSRIALHQAALYLEGAQEKFPAQMIDTLEIVAPLMKEASSQRVSWLMALREVDFKACVEMSVQANCTPFEYHQFLGMPTPATFRSGFVEQILPCATLHPESEKVAWLMRCTLQMTRQEIILFCDTLLTEYEQFTSDFYTWLSEHCLPNAQDTLWFELASTSKNLLKKLFKLSSYYSLNSLVDKMCEPYAVNLLTLSDRDIRQLKSRARFWSNYSEHFSQTRLLIPEQTYLCLGLDRKLEGVELIKLPDHPDENAEVCVFEINDKIIVEVLRGDASEIRVFESTSRNKKRLLQDGHLTLKTIREMACTSIHDHVRLWQYFCELMLRAQHGVKPNLSLKYFNGLPKSAATYSHKIGLPKPPREQVEERMSQLEAWDTAFWSREAKIKGLEYAGLKVGGWHELQLAKIFKVMKDQEQYLRNLNLAADGENPEAMYLLGTTLINSQSNSAEVKRRGEYLLMRSAELRYKPAVEVSKKFGLHSKDSGKLNSVDLKRLQKKTSKSFFSEGQVTRLDKIIDKDPINIHPSTTQELSDGLKRRIYDGSDRPYLSLLFKDLEELSKKLGHDEKVKEQLLIELKNRMQDPRVKQLIDTLNA